MTNRILSVVVVVLMLAAAFPFAVSANDETSPAPKVSDRSRFPPIRVNGDAELRALALANSWPGDGNINTPIMIQNLNISGAGAYNCIYIGNVTISFKIQNCTLTNAWILSGPYYSGAGIAIYNTKNAYMWNNTLTNNHYGVDLEISSYAKVLNNNISNNQVGVLFLNLGNAEFGHNFMNKNNMSGIQLADGAGVWIHNNTATNNGNVAASPNSGIMLWGGGSINNLIENNYLKGNYAGFSLRASGIAGNVYRGNTVMNCTTVWIECTNGATGNTFYHNAFYAGGAKTTGITAADKFDNGYPSGGNYWSGYAGVDNNWGPAQNRAGPDGMGDTPFGVEGAVNDNYPWMGPRAGNRVQNLNTSQWYATIQWAVENASSNSVLFITNGTYNEDVSLQSKPGIELRGESRENVIVSGASGTKSTIVMGTNDCIVGNLTVTKGGNGGNAAGLQFFNAFGCKAYNVTATRNWDGFTIVGGSRNRIVNCHANYSTYTGIGLYNSAKQCTIIDTLSDFNTLYGLDMFQGSGDNTFDNCTFTRNLNSGVLVNGASNQNKFLNCSVSVNDMYGYVIGPQCDMTEIIGGQVWSNQGPGMIFSKASGNTVKGVKISGNTGVGIRMEPDAVGNLIHHNQFIDNNVTTGGYLQASDAVGDNKWNQPYPQGGNYWANYNGSDYMSGLNQDINGSDLIGDTPQPLSDNGSDRYPLIDKPGTSGNVSLVSVMSDMTDAIIGIDSVKLTATVNTTIAHGIMLDVIFLLDNVTPLGHSFFNINPSSDTEVVMYTNFSGATDGPHYVNATFEFLGINYSAVSDVINLTEPWVDIVIVSFRATPANVIIEKGKTVDVVLAAELENWGVIPGVDFQVNFYIDGNHEFTLDVNDTINPTSRRIVDWIWTVSENVSVGTHTVSAGIWDTVPGTADYWADANVTVSGVPDVRIDLVATSQVAAFEGTQVELRAVLYNNGTGNSTPMEVGFYANGTRIGVVSNVTVPAGAKREVKLNWTLPEVDGDTNMNVSVTITDHTMFMNVGIIDRLAKMEILLFSVPDGMRPGISSEFRATVRNNGNADAVNATLSFYDTTSVPQVQMYTSAPFNLTVGGVTEIIGTCNITAPAGANHTFVAVCGAGRLNVTKPVGAAVVPATITIKSFTVNPQKMTDRPKDSTQTFTITLVLQNAGELPGSALITITEGTKNIAVNENRTVLSGTNGTFTYSWQVKGAGTHTAQLQVIGPAGPLTNSVSVELKYKAASTGGDNSLMMIIAVVVIIAVVGGIAAMMMMRKKKPAVPNETAPAAVEPVKPEAYKPGAPEKPGAAKDEEFKP